VLVWGAWREALDRTVATYRAALGRRAALGHELLAADTDAGGTAEHDERIRAAARAVSSAARALPDGWLGMPWADLSGGDALPPLGEHPGTEPVAVRIGSGFPATGPAEPLQVPLHVALLGHGHLTIDAAVRDARVSALFQGVLVRVLAALPAGSVRVLAHDPAGLGRVFAPLRPLIDAGVVAEVGAGREGLIAALDEADAQVRRTWRTPSDRPPYLLLALAGLAANLGVDVEARLAALAHAGPAAGVALLIAEWPPRRPAGHQPPPALDAATMLTEHPGGWAVTLAGAQASLDLPVELDPAPTADLIRAVCGPLAAATAEQDLLSFDQLLIDPPWTENSATGLATPIGRSGRSEQVVRFDDATPHWLVGGRSGSGKTVFLLDLLAGLTVRYPPSELALYLLDFKEGVSFTEFTPTARDPTWVPHAVAVGIESDREYGLAVLRALRAEMDRRATEFKRAGVTKLSELRQARPRTPFPRVLTVIDEFQVLFAGNDAVARQATELLEDVARKGRSFGIHLVLASQTTSGIEALQTKIEAIFGQFPMRIALAGGGGVLDLLNSAADGLPVGSAVVNPAAGILGANTLVRLPFADPDAVGALRRRLWRLRPPGNRPPAVFAGFAAQHLDDDPTYATAAPGGIRRSLLLGRRIDVGSRTAVVPLDATPGRHLAVIGPSATGADVLQAAVTGLGRQHRPGEARFLLAPLVPAGDAAARAARTALELAGHQVETVPLNALGALLAELARFTSTDPRRPAYLVLFGADAAGPALAAISTESFRPGTDDLRAVVQQGPLHGVHLLGWWRGLARLSADLGPTAREDVACLVVLNVPGPEVASFLGQYDLHWQPRPNRALLLDRHEGTAQVIVPFVRSDRDDSDHHDSDQHDSDHHDDSRSDQQEAR
jgi:DNA segregation ATPase FtsK/SpoIIIE, S-DNA-T family